jgi:hypothetical protein
LHLQGPQQQQPSNHPAAAGWDTKPSPARLNKARARILFMAVELLCEDGRTAAAILLMAGARPMFPRKYSRHFAPPSVKRWFLAREANTPVGNNGQIRSGCYLGETLPEKCAHTWNSLKKPRRPMSRWGKRGRDS